MERARGFEFARGMGGEWVGEGEDKGGVWF
jgi:hypothetical protein